MATIVLLHSADIPADELTDGVHGATAARDLIEQAKGVLSELDSLGMEQAAARLEELARADGLTASDAAERVVSRAAGRHL